MDEDPAPDSPVRPVLRRTESFARGGRTRDVPELGELRDELRELAQELDKEHALGVTRLFHAMETLLQRECHDRDRTLADTRSELERARLQAELDRLARRHVLEELQTRAESTPSTAPRGQTKRRSWG